MENTNTDGANSNSIPCSPDRESSIIENNAADLDDRAAPVEEKEPLRKKPLTIFGVELVYLYLSGIFFAFGGWIVENGARLFNDGIIDCRYHLLPFISPYAFIPMALHVVLGNVDSLTFFGKKLFLKEDLKSKIFSNVLAFVAICSVIFLGELLVGSFWEKHFGVQLWDYSMQPLHVTQYTGLISVLGFGTVTYLLFRYLHTPALTFLKKKIKFKTAKIICCTLGLLIVLDTIFMVIHIFIFGFAPTYWSVRIV